MLDLELITGYILLHLPVEKHMIKCKNLYLHLSAKLCH